MGTDASHGGDSTQHTTSLPIPATLPSDTPITPTAEQVKKPESEPRVGQGGPLSVCHRSSPIGYVSFILFQK